MNTNTWLFKIVFISMKRDIATCCLYLYYYYYGSYIQCRFSFITKSENFGDNFIFANMLKDIFVRLKNRENSA